MVDFDFEEDFECSECDAKFMLMYNETHIEPMWCPFCGNEKYEDYSAEDENDADDGC